MADDNSEAEVSGIFERPVNQTGIVEIVKRQLGKAPEDSLHVREIEGRLYVSVDEQSPAIIFDKIDLAKLNNGGYKGPYSLRPTLENGGEKYFPKPYLNLIVNNLKELD